MKTFNDAARLIASKSGRSTEEVKRAAISAARGSSYSGLAKFLPVTDISVSVSVSPGGLKFLSITDISVGFDRPVHSRDSKGVGRARSNGRSKRKVVQA